MAVNLQLIIDSSSLRFHKKPQNLFRLLTRFVSKIIFIIIIIVLIQFVEVLRLDLGHLIREGVLILELLAYFFEAFQFT